MSLPKVLSTFRMADAGIEPLNGLAEVIQGPGGGNQTPREEVLAVEEDVAALINQGEQAIDAEMLERFPHLQIVANVAVGIDNFDLELMARRGVWATNSADPLVAPTADAAFGLMLCLARRLVEAANFVQSGNWKSVQHGRWNGSLLAGKTLGLLGYGRIARAMEKRALAFGMKVIHHRQSSSNDAHSRPLEDLLAEADFVSIHTPLTPQTHKLINARRLAQMKRGACLINTARGPVVDEEAVVDALDSGHLGGVGLDVFEKEPAIHPGLFGRDNAILTPHLGGSATEGRLAAQRVAAMNVAAVLRGERPPNPVNEPQTA